MVKVTCHKCGHKWNYLGESIARYIKCSICYASVPNPNFKKPKGDD